MPRMPRVTNWRSVDGLWIGKPIGESAVLLIVGGVGVVVRCDSMPPVVHHASLCGSTAGERMDELEQLEEALRR